MRNAKHRALDRYYICVIVEVEPNNRIMGNLPVGMEGRKRRETDEQEKINEIWKKIDRNKTRLNSNVALKKWRRLRYDVKNLRNRT